MLITIFIASSSILSVPFVLWRIATVDKFVVPLGPMGLINAAAFGITLWMAVLLTKRNWRVLTKSPGPAAVVAVASLVLAAGMMLLCSELYNWTIHLLPPPAWVTAIFNELFNIKGNPVGAFFTLSMVAPIAEEFMCRRWLLESLLQRMRPSFSIALSALAFGLMHLNPWQFFYATALGLGLGWIYWRSRSVWICILWHALNNGLVIVFNYWAPDIEGFRPPAPGQVEFQPLWLTGSGLALVIVGVILAVSQKRTAVDSSAPIASSESGPAVPTPPVLPPPLPG